MREDRKPLKQMMEDLGIENVADLEGGFNAYKEAGGAVAEVKLKERKEA